MIKRMALALALILASIAASVAPATPALASGCNHNFINSWGPGFWITTSPGHSYYAHASAERFTGDASSTCQDINATNVTMGPPCTSVLMFVQLDAGNGFYFGPVGPTTVPLGSPNLTVIYLHNGSDPGNGRGYRVLFSSDGYESQGCAAPTMYLLD